MKARRRDWATLKKEKEWDELIRKHTKAATAAENGRKHARAATAAQKKWSKRSRQRKMHAKNYVNKRTRKKVTGALP